MISFFSSWAKQIVFAVIISSVIEMILPDNKNKKYVKMVIGLYILFTIISPVINHKEMVSLENLDIKKYTENVNTSTTSTLNQTSMDERLKELYIQELENNVIQKTEESGYNVHSCKVDAVLTGDEKNAGINKIYLTVGKKEEAQNSSINSINKVEIQVGVDKFTQNDEDNSTDNLKEIICNYYNIEKEKVKIKNVN